ncbi:tRNA (adenosine(37)-N6)-threonylcarbamoyltransferase complex dimerization subunit type 1 TsaB [Microbacterium terrisoli]|uniref:tRNA (adenosine(37)-N6)-threonylcarbamoyltransferase complex dimerization subunit type 1 TsaB n=1 Tax=Microbacterium terrisoli TaxID=3242192 RepID=UPI00280395FF|nr:tRNA (adenosine(37)-N6)-threonylcarbamoyltransferase complex dimerization subunit type 1 TsaB [Microbacterium protaetiae]
MILGIDTSTGTAVGLVEPDGLVVAEKSSPDPRGHAEVIGTLLAEVASTASVTHVAAGMGPGPFTGLRVGIAAARAFALGGDGGRGIPVIPVVSHDAAAFAQLVSDAAAGIDTPRFAVVTDARRREFAFTVYDGLDDDGLPVRATEPALAHRDELDATLAGFGAVRLDTAVISAAMLAVVAARALVAGRTVGPHDALYLRSPDVVEPATPKRVAS